MDEVDLLLHPLKSELNFPIGDKHPLDLSPERWTCAIHALDAVFFVERKAMSVPFQQSGRAHQILSELSLVIEEGYEQRALQRSPHLTLLNTDWYNSTMKPIMARWLLLWLEANHVAGVPSEQLEAYLASDGRRLVDTVWGEGVEAAAAKREAENATPPAETAEAERAARALRRLHVVMEQTLTSKAMQLLNIASEWLRTYLPHTISKIDRVSFGLLSSEEYKRLAVTEPHMPRSRLKLAIPFLGKDVPSQASEFAHPDIMYANPLRARARAHADAPWIRRMHTPYNRSMWRQCDFTTHPPLSGSLLMLTGCPSFPPARAASVSRCSHTAMRG